MHAGCVLPTPACAHPFSLLQRGGRSSQTLSSGRWRSGRSARGERVERHGQDKRLGLLCRGVELTSQRLLVPAGIPGIPACKPHSCDTPDPCRIAPSNTALTTLKRPRPIWRRRRRSCGWRRHTTLSGSWRSRRQRATKRSRRHSSSGGRRRRPEAVPSVVLCGTLLSVRAVVPSQHPTKRATQRGNGMHARWRPAASRIAMEGTKRPVMVYFLEQASCGCICGAPFDRHGAGHIRLAVFKPQTTLPVASYFKVSTKTSLPASKQLRTAVSWRPSTP